MKTIQIQYDGLSCRITGDAVSGQIGTLSCAFAFSADWDGYVKTAVFSAKNGDGQVLLDENNACVVPSSLLEKPGTLTIGVYGTATGADGDILRYAGRCAAIRVDPGVSVSAAEASDADATAYEQLLARVIALEDASPSGGSSSEWTLLSEMAATTENAAKVEFTGLPDYREYAFCANIPRNTAGNSGVRIYVNNILLVQGGTYFVHSGQNKNAVIRLEKLPNGFFWMQGMASQIDSPYNQDGLPGPIVASSVTAVNALKFALSNTATSILAGASWKLFGRN